MSIATPLKLDDLLVLVARGDLPAFRNLYDATAPRVLGLARSIVRDPTRAEDITQDAFLDIWRRAAMFDPARSPAIPWIFLITHARAVDHIRRSERIRKHDTLAARNSAESADYDQVIETVLARQEPTTLLNTAVAGLTPFQREAIQLTYWGDLTGPDASRALGIPLPTFKARLRDAMLALRAAHIDAPAAPPTKAKLTPPTMRDHKHGQTLHGRSPHQVEPSGA
ncbi:MAG: sigma-70 family RNA polymerase sigma factor [Nakamurella sp.]